MYSGGFLSKLLSCVSVSIDRFLVGGRLKGSSSHSFTFDSKDILGILMLTIGCTLAEIVLKKSLPNVILVYVKD